MDNPGTQADNIVATIARKNVIFTEKNTMNRNKSKTTHCHEQSFC